MHGNQLGPGPGVQLAVELGAASVDHCTYLSDADVDALADAAATTVATLLPGVEFCTRSPYPGRARGCSAPGCRSRWPPTATRAPATPRSMPFVIALAVREMGLTPGAGPVRRDRRLGAGPCAAATSAGIVVGARADLAVLEAPSHLHLAYRPGVPIARTLELLGPAGSKGS